MELTEKDVRDLIPMDGGALDGGGESCDVEELMKPVVVEVRRCF